MDRGELSPGLQQKIVFAGANHSSFANAHRALEHLADLKVNAKQIERVTERIGRERCAERDAEVAAYLSLPLTERKDAPPGVSAPAVAVVGVDGGRLQIFDRSADAERTNAAEPAEAAATDEAHRGKHWREDKIGLLMTMTSEASALDPCPEVPTAFLDPTRILKLTRELQTKTAASVESAQESPCLEEAEKVLHEAATKVKWQPPEVEQKHLVASRQSWAAFGPMVATLAWRLGFYKAVRKAFIGDGSDNNWALWRTCFSSFVAILDIIHAISYVFAAAMAGRPFQDGWDCYARWMVWVWQGEIERVIAALAERQAELGAPQEQDGETHPRQVVSRALGYLQNHKDKMRYPEYRRLGLPITSSYVESAVKQFNQRVKGTEKFWSKEGAEAVLQLRADYLSEDARLNQFWETRQATATGMNAHSLAA